MTSLNAVEYINSCRPAGDVSDAVGQLVKNIAEMLGYHEEHPPQCLFYWKKGSNDPRLRIKRSSRKASILTP